MRILDWNSQDLFWKEKIPAAAFREAIANVFYRLEIVDIIKIKYNGEIAESYPAQITEVSRDMRAKYRL